MPVTDIKKAITKTTVGKNQLGEVIGKPKPGDIVKVHYHGRIMKPDGTRGEEFISTQQFGRIVTFQCIDINSSKQHKGLYVGLNEIVQTMELGEEANVTITSAKAFGSQGLSKNNNPSPGGMKSEIGGGAITMPDDPKAPTDHYGRNPICISYVSIPSNTDICLINLKLMQINQHRRSMPTNSGGTGCCDCLASSFSGGTYS